jgi:hypothetical protein
MKNRNSFFKEMLIVGFFTMLMNLNYATAQTPDSVITVVKQPKYLGVPDDTTSINGVRLQQQNNTKPSNIETKSLIPINNNSAIKKEDDK